MIDKSAVLGRGYSEHAMQRAAERFGATEDQLQQAVSDICNGRVLLCRRVDGVDARFYIQLNGQMAIVVWSLERGQIVTLYDAKWESRPHSRQWKKKPKNRRRITVP